MTGEYRRPGEAPGGADEAGGIALDAEVRSLARRYRRVGRLLTAGVVLAAVGGPGVALPISGTGAALAVLLAVAVLGVVPAVRVRGETELRTARSPSAVRAQFRRPVNPVTALSAAWADAVDPTEVEGTLGAVRVRTTFLGARTGQYRIAVTDGDGSGGGPDDGAPDAGGPIRLWFSKGGEAISVARIRIRADGDGTLVTIDGRPRSRLSGLGLLANLVEGRYQTRVLERYGYEVVQERTHFALVGDP